jgi:dipeptidyl aminopeptidase/acylaminoacyl peptidase
MRTHPILTAALLLSTVAAAQTKRPMTFEDMMQMRRLGSTDVSPDGKWLLYSVTSVSLEQNTKTTQLWIQPIAGGEPKILEGAQPNDDSARFSHDGKQLLFLSSRGGSRQIYIAGFDNEKGQTSNIKNPSDNNKTPRTNVRTQTETVKGPRVDFPEADNAIWSPDGQSIVFTAQVYPDCPAIVPDSFAGEKCNSDRDAAQAASQVKARIFDHLLYRHWDHFTGDKRSHLFQLSVENGAIRDLTPNDPHDVPPFSLEGGCGCAISPDSKELAFTENLDKEPAISTNADIFTLDLTNPASKPVKISTSPGGDFSPAYSPDGKYLAWRSQARASYESDKFLLAVYDREAKSTNYPLSYFDLWVDEFAWSFTSTDNVRHILFVSGEHGESQIYEVNLDGGNLKHYSKVRGEWSGVRLLGANRWPLVVGNLTRVDQPSETVLGDLTKMDTGTHTFTIHVNGGPPSRNLTPTNYEPQRITHLNDSLLAQLDLSKLESFWFPSPDGTKVQGFLIKPPSFDPTKKYPVKFIIHGGPQGAWGDDWSYRWNAELLAANGYVVVMINPRGSTGYGQAFVEGVSGDWGGKPYTDLMTGLDYAEQHYPFIDKSRECALGASYGGYMANWILGHTNRFKCIVTHDGMFDPESAYGATEELWFNEWEFKGKPWDYYGKPDSENPFRKWSPALSAKNFKTPTLVIHSQLDYRLDVSEGYQLFTTLQRLGIPSKMLYFPDESHFVQKPQNSQLWYKTVNDWVDQWTK